MTMQNNVAEATVQWYLSEGWQRINHWLTQFAAKHYKVSYLGNLDCCPGWVDKRTLTEIFNSDSNNWSLAIDDEGDLICSMKRRQ